MHKELGFTLIEVIIFIVIVGLMITGLIMSFSTALESSPDVAKNARAIELAQQRMEFILGQRKLNGFASTIDPCDATPTLPACQVPVGYSVSSSVADNWGSDTDYKVVTVTVSGDGVASLQGLVANY